MTGTAEAPPVGAILEWIAPYDGEYPRLACPWWVRVYDPQDAHKVVIREGPPPDDWRWHIDIQGYRRRETGTCG